MWHEFKRSVKQSIISTNEKTLRPQSHFKRILGLVFLSVLAKVNWEIAKRESSMRDTHKVDQESSLYSHGRTSSGGSSK